MIILGSMIYVYLLAAILPAVFLLVYIYRQDKVEKEPAGLLMKLFFFGVLAALISIVLETIGEKVLVSVISTDNPHYVIFSAFLVVAVVEEGTKFLLMRAGTWRNPNFNFRFDGIVYAVFVSLGFAAFENIGYVFGYGITVAPSRALLAIPGHMSFAVYMGFFYGRAKLWYDRGNHAKAVRDQLIGYLAAVFFHGFYDSCAMIGSSTAMIVFLIFVILMYISVYRIIRYESNHDAPV